MNSFMFAVFFCVGLSAAFAHDDGQWRGEGLLESQDHGHGYAPLAYAHGYTPLAYSHGYAPLAYAHAHHDGQWRGEGLLESQDHHNLGHAGLVVAPYAAHHGVYAHGVYAHGGAPIGLDGRVVDTPEVAHAKAAHFAAKAAAGSHGHHGVYAPALYAPVAYAGAYSHGGAPIGHDGHVVDTPEVAHAKAAHFAAKAAAGSHGHGWH